MRTGIRARLDTPIACLLVSLLALSLFTCGKLAGVGFDPSAFIFTGDGYSQPRDIAPGVAVLRDSAGYDGQFYYRLSLDPFTSRPTDFGVTLDNPAYRHQRFLYPFIVHLVSCGDARFVPAAMIATNFAFFGLLAWIAGRLAQTLGRHAMWGLLVAGYPGFLISYSRDLVEIVEAAFLLGSVLLLRRGRPTWATASLTLAVLTRETSLLVAVAAAAVFAQERWTGRSSRGFGASYFVVPMIAFGALQVALYVDWGRFPVGAGSDILRHGPFAGIGSSLAHASAVSQSAWLIQAVALVFVVVASLCILVHLFATAATPTEKLACLLYGLLLASVGEAVWIEDTGVLRVFTQFYLFGAVAVLATRSNRVAPAFTAAVGATWLFECGQLWATTPVVHLLRARLGIL